MLAGSKSQLLSPALKSSQKYKPVALAQVSGASLELDELLSSEEATLDEASLEEDSLEEASLDDEETSLDDEDSDDATSLDDEEATDETSLLLELEPIITPPSEDEDELSSLEEDCSLLLEDCTSLLELELCSLLTTELLDDSEAEDTLDTTELDALDATLETLELLELLEPPLELPPQAVNAPAIHSDKNKCAVFI